MTEDRRLKDLEGYRINTSLADAVRAAGGHEKLGPAVLHAERRWKVTDDLRVVSDTGETPTQVVKELRADPDFAAVFGEAGPGNGDKPSWEGKSYLEMNWEEKKEFIRTKYGKE